MTEAAVSVPVYQPGPISKDKQIWLYNTEIYFKVQMCHGNIMPMQHHICLVTPFMGHIWVRWLRQKQSDTRGTVWQPKHRTMMIHLQKNLIFVFSAIEGEFYQHKFAFKTTIYLSEKIFLSLKRKQNLVEQLSNCKRIEIVRWLLSQSHKTYWTFRTALRLPRHCLRDTPKWQRGMASRIQLRSVNIWRFEKEDDRAEGRKLWRLDSSHGSCDTARHSYSSLRSVC